MAIGKNNHRRPKRFHKQKESIDLNPTPEMDYVDKIIQQQRQKDDEEFCKWLMEWNNEIELREMQRIMDEENNFDLWDGIEDDLPQIDEEPENFYYHPSDYDPYY